MKNNIKYLIIWTILFAEGVCFAQDTFEITIGRTPPGNIDMSAFTVLSPAKIKLQGTASSYGRVEEQTGFFGWIVESKSRRLVWHVNDSEDYDDYEGLFNFRDEITLQPGQYEVYFGGSAGSDFNIISMGDFWKNLFGRKSYRSSDRRKLHMKINGDAGLIKPANPESIVDELTADAIAKFIRTGDSQDFQKSFSVNRNIKVRVYSLGEASGDDVYDVAWIMDEENNKRIWSLGDRGSKYAGGGSKNIMCDEVIELPKGSYSVSYLSDDSHSYDKWNVTPPYDPQFYGITIWVNDKADLNSIVKFNPENINNPIIEMIKVKDNKKLSQGIKLKKDLDLRILSLGERGHVDMADYGWIVDADTKETIWKMTKQNSEHAGGASKNRIIDDIVKLKAGNYIVYYVSDGSHSFNRWNSTPPFERERWGITIWTSNKEEKNYVELFDESRYKSENVIVDIVRVGNKKRISRSFSLKETTKIRIIAVGEGVGNRMVDYGWIEDASGELIWELTYRNTIPAGGATKNRLFDDTIILEKGNYSLFYHTDDSHAYNSWNSSPPDNPELYGITILKDN